MVNINMKAFISVDLEGLPYVVIPGHLSLKGSLYQEARKIATEITLTVAEELHKEGAEEVLIADSHGPMVNLLVDELPEYVEIIRGNLRPVSMIAGVEDCDVALFLGYHAKHGTAKSTFDHTYSGSAINSVKVNGVECSEFLLNSYVAGEKKVPVILVAGEKKLLEDDVYEHTPWVEAVALKQSYSRYAARSPSMKKIKNELREAVRKAVEKYKEGKVKTLVTGTPVEVEVAFKSSAFAYVADLLPFVKRVDGTTIFYSAETMTEAYKIFQLLVTAAGGVSALTNYLQ